MENVHTRKTFLGSSDKEIVSRPSTAETASSKNPMHSPSYIHTSCEIPASSQMSVMTSAALLDQEKSVRRWTIELDAP